MSITLASESHSKYSFILCKQLSKDVSLFINNPKEITQLHRSTRVTKLTAKDTEKGYYVIVGVFLNINNINNKVEEMKKWGYDAQVYYNRDQVLNFIYVARYDKYEDAVKKVDEIRENTEIPDPWILDVANYD